MEPLRVMIADDDAKFASDMDAWLIAEGYEVAGYAHDGRDVLPRVSALLPDVLLLDLVLPGLDGLAVLEAMAGSSLERMPVVIALVGGHMGDIAQLATRRGAYAALEKPITAKALRGALDGASNRMRLSSTHFTRERVSIRLIELGIPAHLLGYQYLIEAIMAAGVNHSQLKALTTMLYPEVAERMATTSTLVERSIRHAIEVAWGRGAMETQYEMFGNTIDEKRGKPTNGEFIARMVERLRLEVDR